MPNSELSVLICTLNDRVAAVPKILTPTDGVHYVVSFQYTDSMFLDMIPSELRQRDDVTLLLYPDVGLCANRNNALRHCSTALAVIADDDTHYSPAFLGEIAAAFSRDPGLDVLVFGGTRLAFRVSARLPQFDTRFGLGSAYLACGEEEVFLHQARTFGLKVCELHSPLFTHHNDVWTQLPFDKRTRRSWGALQYMQHSTPSAVLRILWRGLTLPSPAEETWTIRDRRRVFRDLFKGLRYIMTHPLNDAVAEEIPLDFQPIDIWRMP